VADVVMPRLGVSVTEGTLSTWLKRIGDSVEVGEPICEVSTDKVDTEIESTAAGTLSEQLFAEGDTIPVGVPLARIVSADEHSDAGTLSPSVPSTREPKPPEGQPLAPPSVEAAPQDHGERAPEASLAGDAQLVRLPQMGVSVSEGTLSTWLKQVGDSVEVGEPICEVSTDKVDTEIESTAAGVVLEHRYAEGDEVPVGEALAVVGSLHGGAVPATGALGAPDAQQAAGGPPLRPHDAIGRSAAPAAHRKTQPGKPAELQPGPFDHHAALAQLLERGAGGDRVMASPAARALATELEVDLTEVPGSGSAGHITRDDVLGHKAGHHVPTSPAALAAPAPHTHPMAPAAPAPSTVTGEAVERTPVGPPPGYEDVPHELVATSRIRRVTAEHMSRSRHTAAHMTTEVDVDLGLLSDVRQELNLQRVGANQPKLSYLPFIARATSAALLEHRDLNATFQTEQLIRWNRVNLGIAVDTPRGLMVPVVHGAERLTLESLAEAITSAATRVREGKAGPDDFRAGTFTISNPGSVGAVSAPAIINQPQVGILGMPTIVRRPWVVRLADGQETIAIRPIIRLALTFDHRAVDGADATRCLVDVKRRLESWRAGDYR